MGITRNAVIGKVHRLGLSGRAKAPSNSIPRQRPKPIQAPRPAAPIRSGGGSVRGNTALAISTDPMLDMAPVFLEDVVVPMSLRVTITELKEAMCRWPLGDPTSSDFRYCGAQTPGIGPYCTHHGRMAYQPVQDRRRERDRERRAAARIGSR
jgi:GcrA cell cycle regulator